MARVVVVSSSEIEPGALSDVVSADDELHIVVPAVEQSRLQWLANDEGDARKDAAAVGESVELPREIDGIPVTPIRI